MLNRVGSVCVLNLWDVEKVILPGSFREVGGLGGWGRGEWAAKKGSFRAKIYPLDCVEVGRRKLVPATTPSLHLLDVRPLGDGRAPGGTVGGGRERSWGAIHPPQPCPSPDCSPLSFGRFWSFSSLTYDVCFPSQNDFSCIFKLKGDF